MKKIININLFFKICLFSFVLLSNVIMYSQDPASDTETASGLESQDAAAAPINTQLLLLAGAGIGFAIYAFNKNSQRA